MDNYGNNILASLFGVINLCLPFLAPLFAKIQEFGNRAETSESQRPFRLGASTVNRTKILNKKTNKNPLKITKVSSSIRLVDFANNIG